NVAARLTQMAKTMPDAVAVVEPLGYDGNGKRQYRQVSFRELDEDSDRIARGLAEMDIPRGTRLALLVKPGIDFISLVFATMKAGTVSILIDPGMGRENMIRCLQESEPEGFVAIPVAQAIRTVLRRRFPKARYNVTVGRRWFWGGITLAKLRQTTRQGSELADTAGDDAAAIIFTTGSTGPPKGVLYSHGNFDAQVTEIRDFYDIRQGEVDLPGFPLFGLFNCAMGVTTIIPDMDPSRPALVDPVKIIEAVDDWQVTQAFGSPAIWNRVGRYCEEHGRRLATVRRVLSAGAPVPAHVLRRMKDCIHSEGDIHTPYGATESLPVASIAASEVLSETAAGTDQGAGVCIGRRFPGMRWKVVREVDGPIPTIEDAQPLPQGQIGELIVSGCVTTQTYLNRLEATANAKIADPSGNESGFWHRMGDVGYLDDQDRFWFCGRMAHRVLTVDGTMYTIPCEAIFNRHPSIYRSALVGVGPVGQQRPVIILEPESGKMPNSDADREELLDEIRELGGSSDKTAAVDNFLLHESLPVDIRHNAKIFREKLAVWAEGRVM
ncbi:MAG: fatty acid CoA ligase family protein, partial [Planctomycetota bacterium]|nr:fatty acid CoA ligase family protein [Planctomycetota bacterium]